MSKSIRLSDELIERAKAAANTFQRSPPQQIEHWAQIGRVMEAALSYPAMEKVKTALTRESLDDALSRVGATEGIAKAHEAIKRASIHPASND